MMKIVKRFKFEILFFLFFIITRLPDLGNDMFNTDVWKWKSRTYDFGTGVFTLDFEKTIQKYHPGVTLMWLGTFAVKIYNVYAGINPPVDAVQLLFQLHFVQKLFVVFAIGLTLSFSMYVLRNLFGTRKALLIMVLLSLEPFNLALTRVFHLEGLMSSFMLASYLWIIYYSSDLSKKRRLIISAIFAGLAVLTKTSALFMFPYAGLVLLAETFSGHRKFTWFLSKIAVWTLGFLVTFVVLWPAMWAFPAKAVSALYRGVSEIGIEREHVQFYFGKLVEDPGPSYYPIVLGFRSSVLLVAGILGVILFWKKIYTADKRKFLLYSVFFVIFYLIQLTIPTKKLDRYILSDILVLSVLTSVFWIWAFEKIKGRSIFKFVPLIVVALLPSLYLHPDYFSYYNPMFGGLKKGMNVIEPKWMIGDRDVIRFFDNLAVQKNYVRVYGDTSLEKLISTGEAPKVLTVGFQEKYYTQIFPFFRNIGGYAVIEDLTPFALNTRYFAYPVWDDISAEETRFGLKYVDSIKVRGVEVYRVYERVGL